MRGEIKRVVLAYSGGLDTSVILHWLKENYGCEVIAYCADVGQGDDLDEIRDKALKTGADDVVVEDLRDEFVRDYVWPLLRANAIYETGYMLGTSIARPVIAKGQVEVAKRVGADTLSHGATGKGNDQVRFEISYTALAPELNIVSPWRIWDFRGREDLMKYAKENGIPISVTKERPYSIDRNLLHISYEGGILEDISKAPPEDMFILTVSPERAPDNPTIIEIAFKDGNPISIDGKEMDPVTLLSYLNRIGGQNGVGRADIVENRYVGIKSRGVYETPGGTILRIAHKALEAISMDREVMHLRDSLIPRYAEMIYYGYWFSPERRVLQSLMDEAQRGVNGKIRLKLYKGNCTIEGRESPNSIYDPEFATFEEETVYNQKDAEGFIRLNALRLKIHTLKAKIG